MAARYANNWLANIIIRLSSVKDNRNNILEIFRDLHSISFALLKC